MKKTTLIFAALIIGIYAYNQTPDWNTSGNIVLIDHWFGSFNQAPIRTRTNNRLRMYMNPTVSTVVNGQGLVDRSGYLGLGRNYGLTNDNWNDVLGNPSGGPLSLLHLSGLEGSEMGTGGFRDWMRSGITFTANNDIMYVGPRRNEKNDVTDAMFVWGDNAQTGEFGPDNLLFTFTSGFGTGTDDLTGSTSYGREIMRLTATGNVGVGPRFNNTSQPQSQLHINGENRVGTWFQITNQFGTGMNGSDGLKIGVMENTAANPLQSGNALLYNQENRHLLFSTNANASLAAVGTGTFERLRISSLGAPTALPVSGYGVYNPGNIPNTDFTRISVSHDPSQPVTRPLSLMHLGYNTGGILGTTDGWRPWMDVGVFSSRSTDHVFVGLKEEPSNNPLQPDRFDAVIAWGDNLDEELGFNIGPDNLRIIFTTPIAGQVSAGPGEMSSADGLEFARFTPFVVQDTINDPRVGFGNFPALANQQPQNTVHINSRFPNETLPGGSSGLRFQDLTASTPFINNPGRGVLAVDSSGDVIYVKATQLGRICGNVDDSAAVLTNHTEIPMGGYNFLFSGQDSTADRVGIGIQGCEPTAKLDVLQTVGNNGVTINAVYNGEISGVYNVFEGGFAVKGYAVTQTENECEALAAGGMFIAESNAYTYGVAGLALGNSDEFCETNNVGGFFHAKGTAQSNIGMFAEAWITGSNDWAAYVNGPGLIMSGPWTLSDAQLKTNVQGVQNATQILSQLNPVTYNFIASAQNEMNVPDQNQYGLIAQELAAVLPELVKTTTVPNLINPADSAANQSNTMSAVPEQISVVNYTELIPILIAGFKEQNERINQLQSQLQACCTASDTRSAEYENQSGVVVPVRLHTEDAPRLGQNIPNPFDVQTRIPVYLPVSVAKAEIIFYSNEGKVIQNQLLFDRGEFSVAADAETLALGIYSYTLYVDGKPVETKRMVKR